MQKSSTVNNADKRLKNIIHIRTISILSINHSGQVLLQLPLLVNYGTVCCPAKKKETTRAGYREKKERWPCRRIVFSISFIEKKHFIEDRAVLFIFGKAVQYRVRRKNEKNRITTTPPQMNCSKED